MKAKRTVYIVVILLILGAMAEYYHLQHGRSMTIYSTYSTRFGDYHEERISVVLNKLYIDDNEACANEIVTKCRNNDFKNVIFSYDYSIPNELQVSVYLSKKDVKRNKVLFSFSYEQDGFDSTYNIVEHPDKFKLEIKDNQ